MIPRAAIAGIFAGLMTACTTTPEVVTVTAPNPYFADENFPGYRAFPIESTEEIFSLDAAAKSFAHSARGSDPYSQMEDLVRRVFDRSDVNLQYLGNANTTASETFHNGSANCLSLSIMTYALAKELGAEVRFRDVEIPEFWTRERGINVRADHINLVVIPREESHERRFFAEALLVDFDPQMGAGSFPYEVIGKPRIVASFYNNKAVEALVDGRYTETYAYIRAAIDQDPRFATPWINLGFLYSRHGLIDYAESLYRKALSLDQENLSAWENLAGLYTRTQREEEAAEINALVARHRSQNPYYHILKGEAAFDSARFHEALKHYRKALDLDTARHEASFGLAKTFHALGDQKMSAFHLGRARRNARSPEDQARYQGKLDLLASSASS